MKHWKFWVAIGLSVTVIVVFQNCSMVEDLKSPRDNTTTNSHPTFDSADLAPQTE